MSDGDKCTIEEENEEKLIYEIKLTEDEYEEESAYRLKEDHLLDGYEEEGVAYEEELDQDAKVIEVEYENYDTEGEQQELTVAVEETPTSPEPISVLKSGIESPNRFISSSHAETSSPTKNITDPDERYLMSCLPAFKRFTPQQKAFVRMEIERLFYQIEFEDESEPNNKKLKSS